MPKTSSEYKKKNHKCSVKAHVLVNKHINCHLISIKNTVKFMLILFTTVPHLIINGSKVKIKYYIHR